MEIYKPGKTSKEEAAHEEEIRYKGKLFEKRYRSIVFRPLEAEIFVKISQNQ